MPEQIKKVRDIKIVDDAKLRKQKIRMRLIAPLLFFLPVWIWRYMDFVSMKSRAWNNAAWRKREKVYFFVFIGGFLACGVLVWIWLMLVAQSSDVSFYWLFFGTFVLADPILNPMSRRWLEPDFSAIMLSQKRIGLTQVPDAMGASFPIAWSPQTKWVRHGYRATGMPPEVFPRHLVRFGGLGYGEQELAMNCIMSAFACLKNVVVVILDADAGGLNFSALKDLRGVVLFDQAADCERALWYIAQLIRQRRKYLQSAPNIVIIADISFGEALIGRNAGVSHLDGAINEIVTEGRNFGVNIVAFPPPQYFYQAIKAEFQHYYDRIQYFTKAKYKIRQGIGDMIEKNVESPEAVIDLVLFDVMGNPYKCKAVAPKMEQVIFRIKNANLPDSAIALWKKFSFWDFPDFQPLPRRDETGMNIDRKKAKMFRSFENWYTRKKKSKIHIGAPKHEHITQPNEGAADGSANGY